MPLVSESFFVFAVICLALCRLLPKHVSAIMLVASCVFCCAANTVHFGILLGLLTLNFATLSYLASSEAKARLVVYRTMATTNVGVLILFKALAVSPALAPYFRSLLPVADNGLVLFPLGLSFIIFQLHACLSDVYHRRYSFQANISKFLTFGLFFPTVSSGPIPRVGRLLPQIEANGNQHAANWSIGMSLIATGLFKKLVVANRLDEYVANVFASNQSMSALVVALAMFFSLLHLYVDFAAYTDIARGIARLLGFELDRNFDRPMTSPSVTEFWRRWHISFSTCLRDYLYTPIFIALRDWGKLAVIISFMVTFVLCGLWHGSTAKFAIFGVLHGTALSLEFLTKPYRSRLFKPMPKWAYNAAGCFYTIAFVSLTEVLFRARDLIDAQRIYAKLNASLLPGSLNEVCGWLGPFTMGLLCLALILWMTLERLQAWLGARRAPWYVALCCLATLFLGALSEGDFVYVQF